MSKRKDFVLFFVLRLFLFSMLSIIIIFRLYFATKRFFLFHFILPNFICLYSSFVNRKQIFVNKKIRRLREGLHKLLYRRRTAANAVLTQIIYWIFAFVVFRDFEGNQIEEIYPKSVKIRTEQLYVMCIHFFFSKCETTDLNELRSLAIICLPNYEICLFVERILSLIFQYSR